MKTNKLYEKKARIQNTTIILTVLDFGDLDSLLFDIVEKLNQLGLDLKTIKKI